MNTLGQDRTVNSSKPMSGAFDPLNDEGTFPTRLQFGRKISFDDIAVDEDFVANREGFRWCMPGVKVGLLFCLCALDELVRLLAKVICSFDVGQKIIKGVIFVGAVKIFPCQWAIS